MRYKAGFLTIPAAIVVAGLMIAVAIIYATGKGSIGRANLINEIAEADPVENLKPVTLADHLLGNMGAQIKMVEFSDTECPFCKRFHATAHSIVKDYGGQVAWVYRHFPLDSLHSKARLEAEATECANELGGNTKFWLYLDRLLEITPSNDGLPVSELPKIAEYVGLSRLDFEKCLNDSRHEQRVEADYQDAVNSGGTGTPYTIIVAQNGKKFVVSGAQPYSEIKKVIDAALFLK